MRIHLNRKDYPLRGSGVRRTKWLEQSESQRLETLVIVIRAYSPTTNHPFYGWFVINHMINHMIAVFILSSKKHCQMILSLCIDW